MVRSRGARVRAVVVVAVAAALVLGVVVMGTLWHLGNRQVAVPTLAEREAHLRRAIDWVVANESKLMSEPNSALWHMLDRSAEITRDPELTRIVERARQTFFEASSNQSPWVRMMKPGADYVRQLVDPSQLDDYQAAFLSAITCGETEM
ncbi:MAG: hypothetical protein RI907_2731, partial [Pseudomonadota bacterium]